MQRGACHRMAGLFTAESACGLEAASAGNHAPGVALAAGTLGIRARIYMPRSTPKVKQSAVRHPGGDFLAIQLSGESHAEAVATARADEAASGAVYVHAYDDFKVMAGKVRSQTNSSCPVLAPWMRPTSPSVAGAWRRASPPG